MYIPHKCSIWPPLIIWHMPILKSSSLHTRCFPVDLAYGCGNACCTESSIIYLKLKPTNDFICMLVISLCLLCSNYSKVKSGHKALHYCKNLDLVARKDGDSSGGLSVGLLEVKIVYTPIQTWIIRHSIYTARN